MAFRGRRRSFSRGRRVFRGRRSGVRRMSRGRGRSLKIGYRM